MKTMVKWILALVGLIALALIFPLVREIFDFAEGNGTSGMLPDAGGTTRNDALLTFMPIFGPVVLFVGIILYVVVSRNKGEGGT